MTPQGIFILKTSKEDLIIRIDSLCQEYHQRNFNLAVFKRYCKDVLSLFESCFLSDTVGYKICYKQVKQCHQSFSLDQMSITISAANIGWGLKNLKDMAKSAFYLKDLPSCKELTELSEADLIAAAKDLLKSKIVKAGIDTMLLAKDMNDAVTIFDVKDFYERLAQEIIGSVSTSQEPLSQIELALLRKCKEELDYCSFAMLKTGHSALKEIKGLAELLKDDKGIAPNDTQIAIMPSSLN